MLAYFLAIAVVFVSVTLFLTAFFRPKIHRQDDFLWSGLGLFYALTLWICAERISGAVLLGQLSIVSLAIAFIWENRQLRQVVTAISESNQALEGFSILSLIVSLLAKLPPSTAKKTIITPKTVSTTVDSQAKTDFKTSEIESQKQQVIVEVSSIIDKAEENVIDALEEIEEIITDKIESQSEFIAEKIPVETKLHGQKNKVDLRTESSQQISSISDLKAIENESDQNEKLEEQKPESLIEAGSETFNDSVEEGFFSQIINTITKPFKRKSKEQKNEEKLATKINEKEDEIIDNFIDEKTTASEVEKAIANFELDDSPQSDSEKNKKEFNKVIDIDEYTAITNDDEIIEEEINQQILLTNQEEYQIESSIKDDEELVIDINELNLDENTDNEEESQELKTDELTDNINQITEDNQLNFDLADIDFDSEDIPEEDTIDSLTDLTGIEIDDNLTGELDDLLAESKEDLGKTEQFFPSENDSNIENKEKDN